MDLSSGNQDLVDQGVDAGKLDEFYACVTDDACDSLSDGFIDGTAEGDPYAPFTEADEDTLFASMDSRGHCASRERSYYVRVRIFYCENLSPAGNV